MVLNDVFKETLYQQCCNRRLRLILNFFFFDMVPRYSCFPDSLPTSRRLLKDICFSSDTDGVASSVLAWPQRGLFEV